MPALNLGDLSIASPAFDFDGAIPDRFAADGENVSPELRWSAVPAGTVELALVCHDPDAPLVDGFTHWVVSGIDPGSGGIAENTHAGLTVGINSVGDAAYMGPAPPAGHGTHHYYFHLYALDTELAQDKPMDRSGVLAAIEGHIIEQARLVGTYRND